MPDPGLNPDGSTYWDSDDRKVSLVDDRDGRVNVIAAGLTYSEAIASLRAIQRGGGNPMLYDIMSEETGRLLSWIL